MTGLRHRDGRHSMGALTTYARPDQMREWHDRATPGDRCIYAIGPDLGSDPSAALARKLSDEGTVHLSRERDGKGWRYFMERRPAPAGNSAGPRPLSEDEARVLDLIADAAARGRPCPSNSVIADRLDMDSRYRARDLFNALVRNGHIRVVAQSRFSTRVIEIADSGQRTRELEAASRTERKS